MNNCRHFCYPGLKLHIGSLYTQSQYEKHIKVDFSFSRIIGNKNKLFYILEIILWIPSSMLCIHS